MALRAVPDHGRHLSNGLLIEGSILARVLGLRLLTLDTTVVLVPADVRGSSATERTSESHDESTPTYTRSLAASPVRAASPGRGLAQAVRSLNEGAEILANAQRNGA